MNEVLKIPKGKVLLYSGGMDSWLIDHLIKPDTILFVRIHTANNEVEYAKLLKLVEEGKIDTTRLNVVDYDLSEYERPSQNYFLPLRNLHFVTLAAHYGNEIYLGATGSSTHYDKTTLFAEKAGDVISYLLSETKEGPVVVKLPFRDTTKTELLKMFVDNGGNIEEAYNATVSCYNPTNGKPCMSCTSCTSKFAAFYNNGYNFDNETIEKFMTYVGNNYEKQKPDVIEIYEKLKNSRN